MSKAITAVGFDYGEIDKDSKGKLLYLAGQIRKHAKGHIEHALAMGEQIQEAHEVLAKAGCEGKFSAWIKAECGISRKTAYNYMNAFARFGDGNCESLTHFTAEAVYLLSGDSVPDQAVKEAIKLADKGHRINRDSAKAVLDKIRGAVQRSESSKPLTITTKPADESAVEAESKPPQTEPPKISGGTTFNVEEIEAVTEAEESTDAGKLFSKIFEHLGKVTRLLDDLKKVAPNAKLFDDVFASLECANQDLHKWKRGAKK